MAITSERFQWALDQLDPSQWRLFERLVTVFLADEFPSLRPVAAMSGDGGADALLFELEDDPTVIIQLSLRKDVYDKIAETCRRLRDTFPKAKVLIYCTNQSIGSDGTEYRRKVRANYKLHLDPRDREWLVTVRNSSAASMAEAEELAVRIVDPLIGASSSAIEKQAAALDDLEAKAAFVYLGLQWADDTREKGLTRLCFEALARSVLRETDNNDRRTRQQVHELIRKLLPGQRDRSLEEQVDGALARLSKRYIRHWRKPDEFCLTYEERVRLAERLSELNTLDSILREHVRRSVETSLTEAGEIVQAHDLDVLVEFSRSVIEKVLLDRGEAFATAVTHDRGGDVRSGDVEAVIDTVVAQQRITLPLPPHVLAATIQAILISPPEGVRRYLRSLADTYTLFAFMRETPDVQSAIVKIFSEGDIWLDASVVLPLFAEELLQPEDRSHAELMAAAVECGLSLHVTSGVVEELTTHIRRCQSYRRARGVDGATGAAPFLLGAYELAGLDMDDFESWLENFVGRDPEVDIAEYLQEVHKIAITPLEELAESASIELRAAVAEVWHEAREKREKRLASLGVPPMDRTTRDRLVAHDVENYVGVLMRRQSRRERGSAFGYKSWWLTLDRTAFRVSSKLQAELGEKHSSPAISPDFMLNYLAIGPVRRRLSRKTEESLPLMLNMSVLDAVPRDLIELATELRRDLSDRDPRIVRRKIRETLEDARRLLGPKANAGEQGLTDEVKARLRAQALTR